jgi:hypothetical protein
MTITQRVIRNARGRGLTVYTRSQWRSKRLPIYLVRRQTKPAYSPADTVVQHITVTRPSGDFKNDCRIVEQIGYERFGSGVSYNWLVDMTTGEIALGQSLDAKGTHTVNDKGVRGYSYDQNRVARAIAVVGMPGQKLSERAEHSIVQLLAAHVDEDAITEGFDYDPHSKFAEKDCPCDSTRDRMPWIRKAVKENLK